MAGAALITTIAEKIERLIGENKRMREEGRKTLEQRDRLREENRELQTKISQLEKRISILELSQGLGSGKGVDNKQAKAQVNRLMREVDRCIALLNK